MRVRGPDHALLTWQVRPGDAGRRRSRHRSRNRCRSVAKDLATAAMSLSPTSHRGEVGARELGTHDRLRELELRQVRRSPAPRPRTRTRTAPTRLVTRAPCRAHGNSTAPIVPCVPALRLRRGGGGACPSPSSRATGAGPRSRASRACRPTSSTRTRSRSSSWARRTSSTVALACGARMSCNTVKYAGWREAVPRFDCHRLDLLAFSSTFSWFTHAPG
jgi:hypothetical protein